MRKLVIFAIFAKLGLLALYIRIYKLLFLTILMISPFICVLAVRYADYHRTAPAYGGEFFVPFIVLSIAYIVLVLGRTAQARYPYILIRSTHIIIHQKEAITHAAKTL